MKPDPATLDRVLFGDDEIWEAEEFRSIWWWDLFLTPVGPPEQRALDGAMSDPPTTLAGQSTGETNEN